MSHVRIGRDTVTRQHEAVAPRFHAWLLRADNHSDLFFIHVTTIGKAQKLMPRRVGTLDEWQEWIEDTLSRVSRNETATLEA